MQPKFIRVLAIAALTAVIVGVLAAVVSTHGSQRTALTSMTLSSGVSSAGTSHSTVPIKPISGYRINRPFFESDGLGQYDQATNSATAASGDPGFFTSGYWVDVPPSYTRDNRTPETLLVWMHGCSGSAEYDAEALSNLASSDRPYIVISLNGPEGQQYGGPVCWDSTNQRDVNKVLTDISQVETHFNINRRRVIIGGYSSGGDLAYQTAFLHADLFAGVLGFNTDPVRDNTLHDSIKRAVAGAAWKFNIFQIMHAHDTTYPPSTVLPHLQALAAAGFPVHYLVRPGHHFDRLEPSGCTLRTCTTGTYSDMAQYLVPQIAKDDWESPAS